MRQVAKANAVFIQTDDVTDAATFCNEQKNSLGQFPGPVPVVYILHENNDDKDDTIISCKSIAQAGVDGILIPMDRWNAQICQQALSSGIEPIPEIPIDTTTTTENVLESLEQIVSKLSETMGKDPVCLVLTPQQSSTTDPSLQSDTFSLPPSLTASRTSTSASAFPRMSSIPLWVSVRVLAGDDRLGQVANLCKTRGLAGCLLRRECLPGGFHTSPNKKSTSTTNRGAAQPNYLDVVRTCWEAILGDLKSTRSKSFSFRSKNNLERSAASKWGSLQRSVLESGALGDPNESVSIVDSDAGDYQGFA
jgi:hypothetical protein